MKEQSDTDTQPDRPDVGRPDDNRTAARERARKRVERKRKLRGDFVAYVAINVLLIGIWAATGRGYFWPGWVLAGWGVFLALDAWSVSRPPITDEDIDREMRRGR
jgi:hypothetical protein